jgi:hypothetical protein
LLIQGQTHNRYEKISICFSYLSICAGWMPQQQGGIENEPEGSLADSVG